MCAELDGFGNRIMAVRLWSLSLVTDAVDEILTAVHLRDL